MKALAKSIVQKEAKNVSKLSLKDKVLASKKGKSILNTLRSESFDSVSSISSIESLEDGLSYPFVGYDYNNFSSANIYSSLESKWGIVRDWINNVTNDRRERRNSFTEVSLNLHKRKAARVSTNESDNFTSSSISPKVNKIMPYKEINLDNEQIKKCDFDGFEKPENNHAFSINDNFIEISTGNSNECNVIKHTIDNQSSVAVDSKKSCSKNVDSSNLLVPNIYLTKETSNGNSNKNNENDNVQKILETRPNIDKQVDFKSSNLGNNLKNFSNNECNVNTTSSPLVNKPNGLVITDEIKEELNTAANSTSQAFTNIRSGNTTGQCILLLHLFIAKRNNSKIHSIKNRIEIYIL